MQAETAEQSCTYILDDALSIVAVDEAWSRFAIENDAPELLPPAPIGRPVLSYLADRTTAILYEQLFHKVQRTGTAIVLPIRCDAPNLRRFLDLHIAPRQPGGLRITSHVVRLEPRPPVALLERTDARADERLRMCSFCKRVEHEQRWREVEALLVTQRVLEQYPLPDLTHVVCDYCLERVQRLLD